MNDEVTIDPDGVCDNVAGEQDPTDADGPMDEAIAQESPDAPASRAHDGPPTITNESITEAVLFATDSPVPAARIAQILGVGGAAEVKKHIESLNEKYEQQGTSFRIEEIAKGYQMLTLPEYNTWLGKLLKVRRESKLSQAALETLAVVAYKQPVMRVGIEEIRGVAVGEVLQRLREMNLVKIVGRAEEIGRPLLYGTTKQFLSVFGLASLSELPKVESLTPPEKQTKQPRQPKESTTDPTTHHGSPVAADATTEPAVTVDHDSPVAATTDTPPSEESTAPALADGDDHAVSLSAESGGNGSTDPQDNA